MRNEYEMDGKLKVYVNDKAAAFFPGTPVRHAIGARAAKRVARGRAIVVDEEGNGVDLDGALYQGERLYVKPCTPEERWKDVL
jgi:hypothetical protein